MHTLRPVMIVAVSCVHVIYYAFPPILKVESLSVHVLWSSTQSAKYGAPQHFRCFTPCRISIQRQQVACMSRLIACTENLKSTRPSRARRLQRWTSASVLSSRVGQPCLQLRQKPFPLPRIRIQGHCAPAVQFTGKKACGLCVQLDGWRRNARLEAKQ
jgi:hypothetical protein